MKRNKPGPKPKDDSKVLKICFRVSKKELNKIQGLARLYTGGDISQLIRMRIFEGHRYGRDAKIHRLSIRRP